jgi:hypothetical protein
VCAIQRDGDCHAKHYHHDDDHDANYHHRQLHFNHFQDKHDYDANHHDDHQLGEVYLRRQQRRRRWSVELKGRDDDSEHHEHAILVSRERDHGNADFDDFQDYDNYDYQLNHGRDDDHHQGSYRHFWRAGKA